MITTKLHVFLWLHVKYFSGAEGQHETADIDPRRHFALYNLKQNYSNY